MTNLLVNLRQMERPFNNWMIQLLAMLLPNARLLLTVTTAFGLERK